MWKIIIAVILAILLLLVLLIFYFSCIAYKNSKPKYKDWKYVWKDWRVYEWDWDKKCWANWKWKLIWVDWEEYVGEFKNGKREWQWTNIWSNWEKYEWYWKDNKANWKWKKVTVTWTILEWTRVDWCLEWKWKLIWNDWWIYEWEFKSGKPHWMWIIKMKNWYYYEWEFSDWKRTWKFKKQILTSWWIVEWEFRDNWNGGFDWIWKVITSDWFTFEWIFKDWKLNWEWKTMFPDWCVCIWNYVNWELEKWKKILKNWECSDWNWINWRLNWLARYYFKDGSYYEWQCKQWNWDWVWTYITKKWDKYTTEFPYEIINVFMYWLNSKMKEIQWNLNYTPKSEKEKAEEKDKYLKIFEKWTLIQKEIVKMFLDLREEGDKFLESIKQNKSINNYISTLLDMNDFYRSVRKNCKKLSDKHHIKSSSKWLCSYGSFFSKLDLFFDWEIKLGDLLLKICKFLDPECVLDFIIKKDQKDKEWMWLIDDFSKAYGEDIQSGLEWREYEKKFWNHNFKLNKDKK